LIAEAVAAVGRIAPDAARVGIAVGGPLNVRNGTILDAPHLPGLRGVALRDRFAAALARPVGFQHDAAACALAEWHWGPDAGADGLAYLTCGTGFGTGLVLGGRVRYGSDGSSPEIGHVRYRPDGPAIFGKPGCFEGYGSAKALALLAAWRDPDGFAAATPEQVVAAARAGDPTATWALDENERAVGAACALLADLLALDVIVLGTLAQHLGEPWLARVRDAFAAEALAVNVARCRIRPAMDRVQDRSALAAALEPAP
jgi:glucokinase